VGGNGDCTPQGMKDVKWENWTSLAIATWIMLVPWLLPSHVGAPVDLNRMIVCTLFGAGIFAASGLELQDESAAGEWVDLVLGAGIALSPWIVGYAGELAPFWGSFAPGMVLVVLAAIALPATRRRERESR
jgi:hypothetical protein